MIAGIPEHSPDANTHLSAIGCREVLLLAEKGGLALRPNAADWMRRALDGSSALWIPARAAA